MGIAAAADYLGKLLNRPIAADTVLRLSSAQRARFNAWLHGQNLRVDDKMLAREFTLAGLLTGAPATAGAAAAAPPAAAAPGASPLALGVDIQSISELMAGAQGGDLKADPELLRLFTLQEISYAQAKAVPAETLAGIFAAKEAMRKCIGEPTLSAEAFRALEVLPDAAGRPVASGFEISISHSGDFAVAVACRMAANTLPSAPPTQAMAPAAAVEPAPRRWLPLALLASAVVLISLHLVLLARLGR